jgi:hypothetical protein
MRVFCVRGDAEPRNRSEKIPEWNASVNELPTSAAYYNRLDLRLLNRVYRATTLLPQSTHAAARKNGCDDSLVRGKSLASPAYVLLMSGGKSCNKQVWGVTRFRRGIAL